MPSTAYSIRLALSFSIVIMSIICIKSVAADSLLLRVQQSGSGEQPSFLDMLNQSPAARAIIDEQARGMELVLAEIMVQLKRSVPQSAQTTVRDVRAAIDIGAPIDSVRAVRRNDGTSQVRISFRFISLASIICAVMVEDSMQSHPTGNLNDFNGTADKMTLIAAVMSQRERGQPINSQPLAQVNQIMMSAMQRSMVDQDFSQKQTGCVMEVLAFIIAHELGHIASNDQMSGLSSDRMRTIEHAADRFAADTLERANMSIFSGSAMLGFFAAYQQEAYRGLSQAEALARTRGSGHPFASCRVERVFDHGVRQLEADQTFRSYLASRSDGRREWNEYVRNARNLYRSTASTFCS